MCYAFLTSKDVDCTGKQLSKWNTKKYEIMICDVHKVFLISNDFQNVDDKSKLV